MQRLYIQQQARRWIGLMLCLWASLFLMQSAIAETAVPLPTEQAFSFSVSADQTNRLILEWRVAPGYYLYSKRLHITATPDSAIDVRLPQGNIKYSADKAEEVFSGIVTVPVTVKTDKPLQLEVHYQGCSQAGFCYPPMQKTLQWANGQVTVLDAPEAEALPPAAATESMLTSQQEVQSILQTQNFGMTLLIFFGIGLLLSLTPCILPMIPILTTLIVGQKRASGRRSFFLSSTYVFGAALAYALAGLLVAMMGRSLQVWLQQTWVISSLAALFVLLALSLFDVYTLQLPRRLQQSLTSLSNKQERGTFAGVFLMGLVSTLIVSPCVTAPLVGVLMFIAETGNKTLGASALFMMGIGMGIPLIIIGTSAGKWFPRAGTWMIIIKQLVGIVMLGTAIWLLSRVISFNMTLFLYGLLFIFAIGLFLWTFPDLLGGRSITRILGSTAGLFGILLVVNTVAPFDIAGQLYATSQPAKTANQFIIVHSLSDFNKERLIALAAKKPILLDFYADWCESCVSMERQVFSRLNVQQGLSSYVLLRADLSDNSSADEEMLKHFKVIAPPTILFFDAKGDELNTDRIVGEVSADEFLVRLRHI